MMIHLERSVGSGGRNLPIDVAGATDLLNAALTQELPLKWSGVYGGTLEDHIFIFQREAGHMHTPDGRIEPHGHTLQLLNHAASHAQLPLTHKQGSAAYRGRWFLDADKLSTLYGLQFGKVPSGLKVLASAIQLDPAIQDIRWIAYMLATAWWETGRKFEPVREDGQGADHDYGDPVTYQDSDGNKYTNVYYGRGYVQLTWEDKYLSLGKAIGLDDALAINPDLALDPKIAYQVMSYGMTHGSFTTAHHKLADYIDDQKCDYFRARRIINGLDHATEIAAQAAKLEMLLRLSCE
ncbi:MAG TPA: glycoside hydrolase family 19 protein [Acetobacteraceae bacterium]|nr:glycoside hydrolase family 19 protein [Acetobacteraceae bacterium]